MYAILRPLLLQVLLFLLVVQGQPLLAAPRQWHLTASLQGTTHTNACMVSRSPDCSGEVTMTYPFLLLDDYRGTRFLVDAGLSRWTQKLLSSKVPPLEAALIPMDQQSWTAKDLMASGLTEADITAVLITHTHWDHTAGLMDLPGTTVWLAEEEATWVRKQPPAYGHGTIAQTFIGHPVRTLRWGPSHLRRWFSRTSNLSGDGTLVAVALPGHTPGNTGYLVQTQHGPVLFIGDLVFRLADSLGNSRRSLLLSRIIDTNRQQIESSLSVLARFIQDNSEVLIVPSHDDRALNMLLSPVASEYYGD